MSITGHLLPVPVRTGLWELPEFPRYRPQSWWRGAIRRQMTAWGPLIREHCGWLTPELVAARIHFESRGDPACQSRAGEVGLLQMWPHQTPSGVDPTDPEANLRVMCGIWRSWAIGLHEWMRQELHPRIVGLPADMSSWERTEWSAWCWLVTSAGPGAARVLASAAVEHWDMRGGYPADLRGALWTYMVRHRATDLEWLAHREQAGSWGRQSTSTVRRRIAAAQEAAAAAHRVRQQHGSAEMKYVLLTAGLCAAAVVGVLAYRGVS